MKYSILLLTLNEEENLPRALASVRSCDDVVVLDSGSTDRTVEIARAAGARVFNRPFDNFAAQRNYAHHEIPFRHSWVFHLDADEEFTPALERECSIAAERTDLDGFYVAPRMIYLGRWIPHCTDFPAWQARFARLPAFQFIEVGHGQREKPGLRLGRLAANYLHAVCPHGEEEWLNKHRRYAAVEARAYLAAPGRLRCEELLSRDPLQRRRALKRISLALPFRPTLRFIYQYLLKRGFLDGRPGWRYCCLLARYEGFIAAELRRQRSERR